MDEPRNTDKWVWTEADFEGMGWHDCHIHALAFSAEDNELLLDIDYLLQWIPPGPGEECYSFHVAPTTLVFWNVHTVEFDIGSYNGGLEINSIYREEVGRPHNSEYVHREVEWLYTIECQQGEITLRAVGYHQFIRAAPRTSHRQKIRLVDRGGYSFAKGRTDAA